MTEASELFFDYLTEEGYRPRIDDDGDLIFKCEGTLYALCFDEDDENYLRLLCPNFWPFDDAAEKAKAVRAANDVNTAVKVAKILCIGDNTTCTAELLFDDLADARPVFNRMKSVIGTAMNRFVSKMREEL